MNKNNYSVVCIMWIVWINIIIIKQQQQQQLPLHICSSITITILYYIIKV